MNNSVFNQYGFGLISILINTLTELKTMRITEFNADQEAIT
jgi:hypothetical protein